MTEAAAVVKMVNTSILVGILVGVFLAGIGGAYAIFANTYGSAVTMQNPQMFSQMITKNPQMMNQWMGSMMQDPSARQQMMSGMMNQVPQDVIVKITSSQKVSVGKKAEISLLVLDKESEKPMSDADVIIGIERGSSMSTMDMMAGMFKAENIGSGKYVVRFTPDNEGIYTLHTHVIPAGKSMHSMMNNHLDIGIIAE